MRCIRKLCVSGVEEIVSGNDFGDRDSIRMYPVREFDHIWKVFSQTFYKILQIFISTGSCDDEFFCIRFPLVYLVPEILGLFMR
jgi:hypothetical protein